MANIQHHTTESPSPSCQAHVVQVAALPDLGVANGNPIPFLQHAEQLRARFVNGLHHISHFLLESVTGHLLVCNQFMNLNVEVIWSKQQRVQLKLAPLPIVAHGQEIHRKWRRLWLRAIHRRLR